MDKNLEKLSALYDSELSHNEMQEIFKGYGFRRGFKKYFS